jgi:hypothetical protein
MITKQMFIIFKEYEDDCIYMRTRELINDKMETTSLKMVLKKVEVLENVLDLTGIGPL